MKVVKKILRFLGLTGDRSIGSITAPMARILDELKVYETEQSEKAREAITKAEQLKAEADKRSNEAKQAHDLAGKYGALVAGFNV